MSGKLVVITGPSGVGKSTITKVVRQRTGAEFSVSATTRSPRASEVNGRDYHFVDRATFEQMIQRGELLEWAEVFGRLYGTPAAPVLEAVAAGRTIILDIDVQGGLQVHKKLPSATYILIVPPSDEELHKRLGGRGSESPESLTARLAKAADEIATARNSGAYNYVVVNDDLEQAIEEIVGIVQSK